MTEQVVMLVGEVIKYMLLVIISLVFIQVQRFVEEMINEKQLKVDHTLLNTYLEEAKTVLNKAVITTSETYVKSLKAQNKFDSAAQKIAFEKTKQAFLGTFNQEGLKLLKEVYSDFDNWVELMIESELKAVKTDDKKTELFCTPLALQDPIEK